MIIELDSLKTIIVADCIVRLEFAHEQFLATAVKTPVVACHLDHFQFRVVRRDQTMLLDIAVA